MTLQRNVFDLEFSRADFKAARESALVQQEGNYCTNKDVEHMRVSESSSYSSNELGAEP